MGAHRVGLVCHHVSPEGTGDGGGSADRSHRRGGERADRRRRYRNSDVPGGGGARRVVSDGVQSAGFPGRGACDRGRVRGRAEPAHDAARPRVRQRKRRLGLHRCGQRRRSAHVVAIPQGLRVVRDRHGGQPAEHDVGGVAVSTQPAYSHRGARRVVVHRDLSAGRRGRWNGPHVSGGVYGDCGPAPGVCNRVVRVPWVQDGHAKCADGGAKRDRLRVRGNRDRTAIHDQFAAGQGAGTRGPEFPGGRRQQRRCDDAHPGDGTAARAVGRGKIVVRGSRPAVDGLHRGVLLRRVAGHGVRVHVGAVRCRVVRPVPDAGGVDPALDADHGGQQPVHTPQRKQGAGVSGRRGHGSHVDGGHEFRVDGNRVVDRRGRDDGGCDAVARADAAVGQLLRDDATHQSDGGPGLYERKDHGSGYCSARGGGERRQPVYAGTALGDGTHARNAVVWGGRGGTALRLGRRGEGSRGASAVAVCRIRQPMATDVFGLNQGNNEGGARVLQRPEHGDEQHGPIHADGSGHLEGRRIHRGKTRGSEFVLRTGKKQLGREHRAGDSDWDAIESVGGAGANRITAGVGGEEQDRRDQKRG